MEQSQAAASRSILGVHLKHANINMIGLSHAYRPAAAAQPFLLQQLHTQQTVITSDLLC